MAKEVAFRPGGKDFRTWLVRPWVVQDEVEGDGETAFDSGGLPGRGKRVQGSANSHPGPVEMVTNELCGIAFIGQSVVVQHFFQAGKKYAPFFGINDLALKGHEVNKEDYLVNAHGHAGLIVTHQRVKQAPLSL